MNKEKPFYRLSFLIVIFLFLLPFAVIMPATRGEIQTNKHCTDIVDDSLQIDCSITWLPCSFWESLISRI